MENLQTDVRRLRISILSRWSNNNASGSMVMKDLCKCKIKKVVCLIVVSLQLVL